MKRREFVEKLGIGSVSLAAAAAIGAGTALSAAGQHAHDSFQIDGPLASATVSFGQWLTTPPLDRFTGVSNTRLSNQHKIIPYDVTIKAGGSVNYLISGTHLILVYAPGTTIEDIDKTNLDGVTATFPGFITDAENRIYRGMDPRPLPLDRVEVVTFAEPGRYLVICGVVVHLNTNMYGYVTVLP